MSSIDQICFGLNRQQDEASLKLFLKKMGQDALLDILVPRLQDAEIDAIVTYLTGILHGHLQKKEYHDVFLDT